ncbi:MAG: HPr family phosphocarrier protein [Actinomycetaceae bacterium]|nr:HPr family phosphocarrier protein [Actinomycetaceae bacterium]
MALAPIGFVIASQSDTLARGVCEVAAPMAPDVCLVACGCHDEGLSRALDHLADACSEAAHRIGQDARIVILADMGPAKLAAHQLLNQWGEGNVALGHGPLVEGAIAGAVAAQQGDNLEAVMRAIAGAVQFFDVDVLALPPEPERDDPYAPRHVAWGGSELLGPRPAARLARMASDYDARVTVNGVDATSVLALMGLKLAPGDNMLVEAEGVEASMALAAIADACANGLE